LIYRHYATLYFIFVADSSESELGILDLIQVFVEALDKCFENVCELDLIFHPDRVCYILDEVIQGQTMQYRGFFLKGFFFKKNRRWYGAGDETRRDPFGARRSSENRKGTGSCITTCCCCFFVHDSITFSIH
jgi:hypothetical protein